MAKISFLARRKKTKTKRPVSFRTSRSKTVKFKARRRPKRRTRVEFQTRHKWW